VIIININVKKVHPDAVIPDFAHDTDTGADLYTCEQIIVLPKEKAIARTGLIFELPEGWGFQVRNKSGNTVKGVACRRVDGACIKEVRADITVYLGTVDQGYRNEVGIMIKNEEDFPVIIPKGTKLAQMVLERIQQCIFTEVEEIDDNTSRGLGGFGSTGSTKQ
jgi:dUTP pyrophosphatase